MTVREIVKDLAIDKILLMDIKKQAKVSEAPEWLLNMVPKTARAHQFLGERILEINDIY